MRSLLFVLIIASKVSVVCAQTPRELLVGSWYFKRGIGGPCESLILDLEYHFNPDGNYSSWAKMKDSGEHRYTGTYTANDKEATAVVNGLTIGPFPYNVRNGVLRIKQPDYRCDVELERE